MYITRVIRRPAVIAGLLLLGAALGMHAFTVTRVSAWQPGYPDLLELGPKSPPPLMHDLHLVGPLVAVVAFLLAAAGAWFHTRGVVIAKAGSGLGLSMLVVLVLVVCLGNHLGI